MEGFTNAIRVGSQRVHDNVLYADIADFPIGKKELGLLRRMLLHFILKPPHGPITAQYVVKTVCDLFFGVNDKDRGLAWLFVKDNPENISSAERSMHAELLRLVDCWRKNALKKGTLFESDTLVFASVHVCLQIFVYISTEPCCIECQYISDMYRIWAFMKLVDESLETSLPRFFFLERMTSFLRDLFKDWLNSSYIVIQDRIIGRLLTYTQKHLEYFADFAKCSLKVKYHYADPNCEVSLQDGTRHPVMEHFAPNGKEGRWVTLYVNMDKYNANPTLNGVLLPKHLHVMDDNQLVNNPPLASLPENNSTVETEAFDGSGSDVNVKIMADPGDASGTSNKWASVKSNTKKDRSGDTTVKPKPKNYKSSRQRSDADLDDIGNNGCDDHAEMREVAKINKSTVATKVPHHDKTQPTYDAKANRRLTKSPSCKFPKLLDCSEKNDYIYLGVRYHSLYRGRVEYKDVTNKGSQDLFKEEIKVLYGLFGKRQDVNELKGYEKDTHLFEGLDGCHRCTQYPAAQFYCPKFAIFDCGPALQDSVVSLINFIPSLHILISF
jgi:hypothetical protein